MKQTRRKFIKTTSAGTTLLMLSSIGALAELNPPKQTMNKNFELMIRNTTPPQKEAELEQSESNG